MSKEELFFQKFVYMDYKVWISMKNELQGYV
jgi:hypothetical protein